jgi:phage terminase small subunit
MREKFVEEYMLDQNGTQAAIRAGYSPHTAHASACRLLKRDDVKSAIAARQEKVLAPIRDRYEVNAETLMRQFALLGFSNMADYVRIDHEGQPVIDLSDADRDQFAAITSIKSKRTTRTIGDTDVEEVTTELRLASKREALADLARIHGLFKEEGGVQVPVRFIIQWGPGPKPEPYDDEIEAFKSRGEAA